MNIRRRPNRSPSAAPLISSTAKLSVYALTVHSSCSIDAPRCTRIVGSAVVTTSASSATISDAIDATANTQPGLFRMLSSYGSIPVSQVQTRLSVEIHR